MYCVMILSKHWLITFGFSGCLELFDDKEYFLKHRLFLCRKSLLNSIRILLASQFWHRYNEKSSLTARIWDTSDTCSQSVSEKWNADHGMCFTTWPSYWMMVIGPYHWSAVATKRLIGCELLVIYWAYWMQSPSDIAVKGNLQRIHDATLDLKLFKQFNSLTWCLNLLQGRSH